jgi:hypothetical protein
MEKNWKIVCAGIASLALAGSVAAAPGGHGGGGQGGASHGPSGYGAGSRGDHSGAPPDSSNRQSLPDADRGLDRADERESDEGLEHSRARDQQTEHAPDQGVEHRNTHSLKQNQGAHGGKSAAD